MDWASNRASPPGCSSFTDLFRIEPGFPVGCNDLRDLDRLLNALVLRRDHHDLEEQTEADRAVHGFGVHPGHR